MTPIPTIPTIAAGTYRLTRDVRNLNADRRYRDDWTKAPTFPAGMELIVEAVSIGFGDRQVEIPLIRAVAHRHGRIGPRTDTAVFLALVAAMEPIPESPAAMFRRLDVDTMTTAGFCLWLVESGKMTAAAFEALFNEWLNAKGY